MNPTGQPFQPPFAAPPPPSSAQNDLNVPSILLMIMAGLGILVALLGVVTGGNQEQMAQLLSDPNLPPQAKSVLGSVAGASQGLNFFGVLLDLVMVFGAWQMRNLKMFPAAVASCIIAMLPCGGCCCLFGLPIGIWALTILLRADVKAQFS
jgi:hypothetical protein